MVTKGHSVVHSTLILVTHDRCLLTTCSFPCYSRIKLLESPQTSKSYLDWCTRNSREVLNDLLVPLDFQGSSDSFVNAPITFAFR
jgi:hypothetical protein